MDDLSFAKDLDHNDPLKHFRKKFIIPSHNGKEQIYFLGNSLGLQPHSTRIDIQNILDQWAQYGVEGFFAGEKPWMDFHDMLTKPLSQIVGALPSEVVVMNHLTVNLHLLLASFYRPDGKKNKIICEAGAFPSDQYMLETHVRLHGLEPDKTIIEIHPRQDEHNIREEDIESMIIKHTGELELVVWGGVNYYTGQLFDIERITRAAHNAGAKAGFDIAHAVGNVELKLHEWNVDFACWCSYKYLNSGPGGVGGAYIHERYHTDRSVPRLAGWWGYDKTTRFRMEKGFKPVQSAEGWQVSTPSMFLFAALKSSLDIFEEAGTENIFAKGKQLSDYLIRLLNRINEEHQDKPLEILTPSSKGCQVSITIKGRGKQLFDQLSENGVFADWRQPDVIRVAPVPLYNTFEEVVAFFRILKKLLA